MDRNWKPLEKQPKFRLDVGGGSVLFSYHVGSQDSLFFPVVMFALCYPTLHFWWKKPTSNGPVTGVKLSARTKFVARLTGGESVVVTVRVLGFGFSFTYQWGY